MALLPKDLELVRASEHFQSLLEHQGFKLVVEGMQKEVAEKWKQLLTISPQELAATQGFIAGANMMLEYANASIREARRILEDHQRDQETAFAETQRLRRDAELQTASRRGGKWADMG
jgi:hypothetical protein